MRFLDEWDKKEAQKKRASLPAAQKMPLQPPLLLTKSGVVMADGKGGGRIITPQAGHNTASAAPIVPALPAKSAAQAAGSAGRTATPQKSEAQRRVDNLPNIHAFGAGDYTGAAGLMEKAWQTGKAGVLAARGAFKEIEGQATPVNREQHLGTFSGFGDLGRAVSESRRTGESIDAITDRLETERQQRRERQRQATFDRASDLFEKSAQAQEQAKEGLGTVGRFMVDMGVTGIQMAGDALVNLALPGGGLYMMGLRSYGQAANEARREGKSEEQQFVAGLKSAGIETLTEKMFGAFGKLYGKAGADELVEKLVTKLTGNKTGQALLTWIINGVGEGVEEVTSDLLNPLADRLLKLDDGRGPMFTTDDAAQMGYDFLLGAAMGLVGGTGQLNRGVKQGKAQTAENAYYENLQKNGLFGGNSGQLAQRAIDAMGRAMPGEYAKLPRLVDAQGTTYEQQQAAYRGAVPRLKNENGLLSLTEQEKVNLSSGAKNKVVSTFQDAVQFVRNALANRASVERAYMGKVPESTARRVMQETGINIDGMGVMMNGVDVRHIIKSHGDPTLETARGQVMVTAEAIAHIPEIIAQPDAVYLSETNDAKGRKAIVFEKRFGDTYITVQGVSNGKNLLQTDTLYIQKGKTRTSRYSMPDIQENAAPEINAQSAPPQGLSYIDTSIPQGAQGVNAQDMRNGVKYAKLPRLVDANGMDAQQRTAWLGALEQMPQAQRNQFETAAQIAKRFGAAVQAQTMQEGVQGSYQNGVIYIDPAAVDPVRQVLIHELTHHMETSGLYGKFSDAALRFVAEDMGADVDALRRTVIEDYAKAGVALDEDGATRELVAKFAEEKLFTDEATVRRMLAQDRNLFQRIYDWLRDTAAKLTGTPEQRRLIDAQNLYEKALRQAETGTQGRGTQLLYAGKNAKTADLNALSRAATMEAEGTDAQTIRRETGWFRGMDGKWRFEVDDSGMEYRRDGDARLMEESGYRRLQELTNKWARNAENRGEPLTAEEAAESERLESKYYDRAWAEKYELADFLRHDDLFEAYPALRHTSVVFKETMPGVNGSYDKQMDAIVLSKDLIGSPESTLVHEIQHIIQGTEEFAGGSNLNYWKYKNKDGQAYKSDRRYLEAERRVRDAFDTMPDTVQETVRQINRAKLDQDWDAVLRLEESIYNGPYAELYSDYTQADFDRRARVDYFKGANTMELYRNTAGEIEARDAASRRSYNAEQRRQLRPDLGNEATVFADGGVGYDIKYPRYSEADIKNNSERLRSMEAVERLSGNELGDRNIPLKDRVQAFFNSLGNNIRTDRFGDVALGNSSVRSEIRHGHTPQKVMTYAAIPSVLQNGVVVYQNVKNAHELERILVAAPVEVGAEQERMYVGVMLQRDPQNQRLYLHDVVTEKEFTTGGNGHLNTTGPNAANRELFTTDILRNALNVKSRQLSTGRSIEEMAGVDTGRTVQENGLYRRDTGDAASEDAISWRDVYGVSDRVAPPDMTMEPVSAQDAADQNAYMERLARDENIIGDDPYTVSDAIYDAQLRRLEGQEAPPERTVEQTTQADLDDLVRLYADQADPIGSREDRIKATESMVTDHTVEEKKSAREKARETWSYLYRKMVDAGHSVSKVSEAVNDPYLYQFYNQARASTSAGVSMIADAQTNVNAQKVGESLNGIFSPIRQKGEDYYHAFQMYLFDLHNIDRMSLSQNKEQAVLDARAALRDFDAEHPEVRTDTEGQLRRMTEDLDPDIAELARERLRLLRAVDRADAIKDKPVFGVDVTAEVSRERARRALQEHPEFEQYREQVRRYIDNLMQYRVDSGLMTQENADFLKKFYPNYVPTLRVTDGNTGAGRDRNAVRIGKTVGRAQGGTEQLMPLHEALSKQTMKAVREGSKNRFGQRILQDYVNAGDSPAVRRYIKDAQQFDGGDFDPDTLNDVGRQTFTKEKTFTVFQDGKLWELTVDDTLFDALKALSPDAAESNTLTKTIRASNNLFKSLVTGYNPTFLVRNTVRDLQTAGLYTRDGKAFLKNYPKALAEIKNNGEYWQMYKALGGSYSSVFDYATGTVKEPTSKAGKLMARLEALNMATEQAPRLAEFMSVVEKGGVNSETLADALYAAADVTVNFGRAGTLGKVLNANYVPFLNPGIQGFDKMIRRVTETKGGREWAKLVGRAVVLGIAPTLLNALLYHDDEEWDDLRDSDKDTNYMFKLKDGIWLKLPKGRELSLLGITADRVTDAVKGENVDILATLNTMGNQVAPANPLTSNIASALVDSQLLNPDSPGRTWYGGDIENQRLQSYAPGQRYDSSTDVFSKAVGGALGISPKKLNYVLDQYTGVVGDFLLPALTPQAERGMFAKAFTTDVVSNNRVSGDFFDEADQLMYAKNGGDETAAVVSRFWSKQQSACSDLWKEIREVEASKLSDKEKRQKTRELKAVVTGIQKNALAVEETYRAAAEKFLGRGLEPDDAYREANRECFGAEYALQTYNKDVYQRAISAKSNGVSYENFYTYYFGTKGIKATREKSAATQKFEWLQSSGMSVTAQAEIYFADMASDTTLKQLAELESNDVITPEQFYQYKVATSGLTKKAEKLEAINMLELTNYQKDALYYLNGWAQSTIGQAPWKNGHSGGTGKSGNPFLRGEASNPFLRAMQATAEIQTPQAEQNNPFLRAMQASGYTSAVMSENPFARALQKREAAQTEQADNPFVRALQRRG